MLEHLGWDKLEQRRNQLALLMLYKIIHQFVEVPHQHILTKVPASTRSGSYQQIYSLIRIQESILNIFKSLIHVIIRKLLTTHVHYTN